jgi:hypothetical protein
MLSKIGMIKNSPGPLAPTKRPSLKITPRSYSFTTFIDDANTITAKNTTPISHSKAIFYHLF